MKNKLLSLFGIIALLFVLFIPETVTPEPNNPVQVEQTFVIDYMAVEEPEASILVTSDSYSAIDYQITPDNTLNTILFSQISHSHNSIYNHSESEHLLFQILSSYALNEDYYKLQPNFRDLRYWDSGYIPAGISHTISI